jgi:putative hydrolase of the HAD superfamily
MVGNSLKSDVLPVVELGGHGVYIPYHVTWAHEVVEPHADDHNGYHELKHIGQLPDLIKQLSR